MRCDPDQLPRYGHCELRCGTDILDFVDIRYSPEDAVNGNPYNTLCNVKVVSGEFAGLGEWEFDWKDFGRFVKELEQLYAFQRQEVEFQDIGYGSKVKFILHRAGRLTVSGLLYGDARGHSLTFEFQGDQTSLHPFLQQLKQIQKFASEEPQT